MTAQDGAHFRLDLGVRSLAGARENLARDNWRDAALFARAAVEHGARAVQSCFSAAPRSHDPDEILEIALGDPRLIPGFRPLSARPPNCWSQRFGTWG